MTFKDYLSILSIYLRFWFVKLSENYGLELNFFYKVRDYSDGINFINGEVNLNLYKADHSPNFRIELIVMNVMLFEFHIYYLFHRESEEDDE
jgi:hypothetical protein